MNMFLKLGLLSIMSCSLIGPISVAKTVNSLSEVEGVIKHQEGHDFYAEQMDGIPRKHPFGILPSDININEFIHWIAPNEQENLLVISGGKPWGSNGLFVGVACFAWSEKDVISAKKYGETTCDYSYSHEKNNKFYIGVFQLQNGTFTPIARSLTYLQQTLINPVGEEVPPNSYNRLDLAPYRINDEEMAIGIRAGFSVGYSGGGAYTEYLQLYRVKSDASIVNIFNEEIYSFEDLAGDWNRDGTRQHHVSETKYTLHVLKTKTDGFYDLQIRQGKEKKTFVWSVAQERYVMTSVKQ